MESLNLKNQSRESEHIQSSKKRLRPRFWYDPLYRGLVTVCPACQCKRGIDEYYKCRSNTWGVCTTCKKCDRIACTKKKKTEAQKARQKMQIQAWRIKNLDYIKERAKLQRVSDPLYYQKYYAKYRKTILKHSRRRKRILRASPRKKLIRMFADFQRRYHRIKNRNEWFNKLLNDKRYIKLFKRWSHNTNKRISLYRHQDDTYEIIPTNIALSLYREARGL